MAIRVQPFFCVVLRALVRQPITNAGWAMLLRQTASGLFDGEIFAFVAMSITDTRAVVVALERAGFRGPSFKDDADMVLFEMGHGTMPSWLQKVDVRHFSNAGITDAAWKLVRSEVYTLHDRVSSDALPRKGYDVDWPPFIGRIDV